MPPFRHLPKRRRLIDLAFGLLVMLALAGLWRPASARASSSPVVYSTFDTQLANPLTRPRKLVVGGETLTNLTWATWGGPTASETGGSMQVCDNSGSCHTTAVKSVVVGQLDGCIAESFVGGEFVPHIRWVQAYSAITITTPNPADALENLPLIDPSQSDCFPVHDVGPAAGQRYPVLMRPNAQDFALPLAEPETFGVVGASLPEGAILFQNVVWRNWGAPVATATGEIAQNAPPAPPVLQRAVKLTVSDPSPSLLSLCGVKARIYQRILVEREGHKPVALPMAGTSLGGAAAWKCNAITAADRLATLGACDVESMGVSQNGDVGVDPFTVGLDQSATWSRDSDGKVTVDDDFDGKFGAVAVFGAKVGAVGTGGSVSGGLEFGFGAALGTESHQSAQTLLAALGSPQALAHPPRDAKLESVTVSMGAWLSGDMGTSAVSTTVEAEGVLGVKLSLTPPLSTSFFVKVHASGDVQVLGAFSGIGTSGGGAAAGDFSVQETMVAGEPTDVSSSFGFQLSGHFSLKPEVTPGKVMLNLIKKAALSAATEGGLRVEFSADLDLTDPLTRAVIEQALAGTDSKNSSQLDTVFSDPAVADQSALTVTVYQTFRTSNSFDVEFGDGAGFKAGAGTATTNDALIAAFAKPPGTTDFAPWTACEQAKPTVKPTGSNG